MDTPQYMIETAVEETTALGGTVFYAALVLGFLISGEGKKSLTLLIGFALSLLTTVFIKLFYFTPRPKPMEYTTFIGRLRASSFPSLHAMRAFVLATLLGQWLARSVPAKASLYLIAAGVGWSRLRLRKHYLIDVIAGAAFGVVIGQLLLLLA